MRIALLLAALAVSDTDAGLTPCRCKPREVGDSGSKVDWEGYTKGVRWHRSLDEARAMARERSKLVFHYQVVGDLDKEGC
jgi:hypothetical protein